MKIDKVRVAGVDYKVLQKEFLEIDGNRNVVGGCCELDATIEVVNDIAPLKKEQVFLHELVHAILFEAGYKLKEHDEDMIDRFSKVLHQVLSDNDFSWIGAEGRADG